MDSVAGLDLHDYFGQFAMALNTDLPNLRRALVKIWLQDPGNFKDAETFLKHVREAATAEHPNDL
jgi:hypothetical protein